MFEAASYKYQGIYVAADTINLGIEFTHKSMVHAIKKLTIQLARFMTANGLVCNKISPQLKSLDLCKDSKCRRNDSHVIIINLILPVINTYTHTKTQAHKHKQKCTQTHKHIFR
jgi:hypothetical protein